MFSSGRSLPLKWKRKVYICIYRINKSDSLNKLFIIIIIFYIIYYNYK